MRVLYGLLLLIAGVTAGWLLKWLKAKLKLVSAERLARKKIQEVRREAERLRDQTLQEGKNQLGSERETFDKEASERRAELSGFEQQINQRFQLLEERERSLNRLRRSVTERESQVNELEKTNNTLVEGLRRKLEEISDTTIEELKDQLVQSIVNDEKRDAQHVIHRAEEEAQRIAGVKAREIVVAAMQRLPLTQTIEHSLTSLETPTPEMIDHLLRNEGRYIRILESMLDVEISIEESPEGFSLSSPDPLNREITRATLDRLFKGGRINPPKIKETVDSVRKEIWETMHREAINVLRELGIKDFKPEALLALGRLLYRYSYGQNNLYHSKEVALLAGMMAVELGGDPQIAKRGGLLHDIGKGFALDGKAHVEMGLELAEKWGEDPRVINAIASHHDDFEPTCVESVIVQIADAISGARPGARRETIANYLDRVEKLESIAGEFEGVDNAYAIYAGRELRILVNSDKIDDDKAKLLAVGIAQKVEERLSYPGKIKVTVIREMKVSSFTH